MGGVSNAQRRRAHRHRAKAYPGPMTPQRVEEHRLVQARLADLERLRKIVLAHTDETETRTETEGMTQ